MKITLTEKWYSDTYKKVFPANTVFQWGLWSPWRRRILKTGYEGEWEKGYWTAIYPDNSYGEYWFRGETPGR